jgi:diguanylate cyclase (GGDEF)-like protein
VALENVQLYGTLENRVRERTAELEQANEEIRQLSLKDELTELHNRRGFSLLASQLLRSSKRSGLTAWLLFADVDGLKQVNDGLGHEAGDRLICAAARALRDTFREQDIIGRIGGDEFAVFGMSAHGHVDARVRLQTTIDRHNAYRGAGPALSMSFGLAESKADVSLDTLLSRADNAMYSIKRARPSQSLERGSGLAAGEAG